MYFKSGKLKKWIVSENALRFVIYYLEKYADYISKKKSSFKSEINTILKFIDYLKRKDCICMKAKGLFMFKSIQCRDKGTFTNKETGEIINYDACNVLICDELKDDGTVKERKFNFPLANKSLAEDLSSLEQYTKIELIFDVMLYSSNAKVEPIKFNIV